MFNGCSSLNTIKIAYTGNFSGSGVPTYAFNNWVQGVAASGTFYYDGEDTTTGNSAIPTGWTLVTSKLTFTARQANSTVAMNAVGSAPSISLEYSTDNGSTWDDFTVGSTTITMANAGDKAHIRAKTPNVRTATSRSIRNTFSITGEVVVSGNLAAILNKDVEQGKVLDSTLTYHLCGLFQNCTSIVGSAKGLLIPFETLYRDSLNSLFLGTMITIAPDLPCLSSEGSTYCYTFTNCTELVQAPALPITTLGTYAYAHMFEGCTSLSTAPELPATTMAQGCYDNMFNGCTSLTTPPSVLPATNVAAYCYQSMFQGCAALTTTPDIKAIYTTLRSGMLNMFRDCTSLVAVKLNDLERAMGGRETFAHVFHGCTSLKEVTLPKLSIIGGNYYCMTECFNGCSSLEKVYMPSLTQVNNSATLRFCFVDCPSLTYVDMGTIATMGGVQTMDYMFISDVNLSVVDFSKATAVPALSNVNAFQNTNSTFKIVVPDALYDQWIAASNWSNFASQIVKASEYINN